MLQLEHVTKYYKKQLAVDDLSFEVKSGQVFGLLGANGAGKSTTVSMIATLMKPDQGRILFEGQNIHKRPEIIKKHLGYVPQDIALYEGITGYDNLIFWGNAYHIGKELTNRIEEVSNMMDCSQQMLSRKVNEYSGGMKRRLNIAVALLHQPKLVIMDEPTVGIDVISRKSILAAIKCLKEKGTSIIYVSHYLEEVESICDRVAILEKGTCILEEDLENALFEQGTRISLEQLYIKLLRGK